MHFPKLLLGTKSAITMCCYSFLYKTLLVVPNPRVKEFITKVSLYLAMQATCTNIIALVKQPENSFQLSKLVEN